MGGGHSSSQNSQNSSIAFKPTVSGHGNVSVNNIQSGGNSGQQQGSSSGAGVTANVQATVPMGLQNLQYFPETNMVTAQVVLL